MAAVKGRADLPLISSLTELGLAQDSIQIQVTANRKNIRVDAYGDSPPEQQFFGAGASINMTLIHFDAAVLDQCLSESFGGAPTAGTLGVAGGLMGNGVTRFAPGGAAGWHFVGLNLISSAGQRPWRFLNTCLSDNPIQFPIGTEVSAVQTNWQAFPYSVDPWNGGLGSYSVPLWDYVLDT